MIPKVPGKITCIKTDTLLKFCNIYFKFNTKRYTILNALG